jgi:hypothetical protein
MDPAGKHDFRLLRQFNAYHRADPPPTRVKPNPVKLLHHTYAAYAARDCKSSAIADLVWLAFYFLLRPGEYCDAGNDNTSAPFRLCDVVFKTQHTRHDTLATHLPTLLTATSVSLTFTNQKNGVKGECIGHNLAGHPYACPVQALLNRVLYLRSNDASPDTPLCAVRLPHKWHTIKSRELTEALRYSADIVGKTLGITRHEITVRSLCASGAMALLLGGIDTNVIKLMGRWRSDEMMRYLHVTAQALTHNHAHTMLAGGNYDLLAPALAPASS